VLGLDVALRTFGWALARVAGSGIEPVAMGLIATEAGDGARSADNFRCAGELAVALAGVLRRSAEPVSLVCAEAMSYPPGAVAAAQISIAWGVVAAVTYGVEVREASPQRIKRAVAGAADASKRDVQDALDVRFGPDRMREHLAHLKRGSWEHPCDALAAIVALAPA
jgi:Holliday junction resolvasome RuvABC endonuclease subunit